MFWFAAAYLSHITPTNQALAIAVGILGVVGLLAPTFIAFCVIWPDADLRADVMRRLIRIKGGKPIYLLLTCFLMLGSILLAQGSPCCLGMAWNSSVSRASPLSLPESSPGGSNNFTLPGGRTASSRLGRSFIDSKARKRRG
jgi:hypothetical protein